MHIVRRSATVLAVCALLGVVLVGPASADPGRSRGGGHGPGQAAGSDDQGDHATAVRAQAQINLSGVPAAMRERIATRLSADRSLRQAGVSVDLNVNGILDLVGNLTAQVVNLVNGILSSLGLGSISVVLPGVTAPPVSVSVPPVSVPPVSVPPVSVPPVSVPSVGGALPSLGSVTGLLNSILKPLADLLKSIFGMVLPI